jgi:Zn-finger nucleic acid-binding protein
MYCAKCWGLWVDHASVNHVAGTAIDGATRANGDPMACPICRNALRAWSAKDIVIDRCDAHGVWFDRSELDHLVAHARHGRTHEGGIGVGGALAVGAVGGVALAAASVDPEGRTGERIDTAGEAVGAIADFAPAVDAAPEIVEGVAEVASSGVEVVGSVAEASVEAAGGVFDAIGAIFDIFS